MTAILKHLTFEILGRIVLWLNKIWIEKETKVNFQSKKNPINILFISEVDKKGGAAKLAYRLHSDLLSRGYNSEMLAGVITDKDDHVHQIIQRNDFFSRLLHKIDKENNFYDFLRLSSFDILKTKEYIQADIIHLHNLHVDYFSKFVLPRLTHEKKTIWTLHDTLDLFEDYPDPNTNVGELKTYPSLSYKRRKFFRDLTEEVVNKSDITVVSPSKWLKGKASRGVFKEKDIRLIYNGVDESIFKTQNKQDLRLEKGIPLDKLVLLFSSAWGLTEGTKDSKLTINLLYQRLKSREDIFFVILGGTDDNFGKNSINIPYQSNDRELSKYYALSDLFIYPSLWDNCPLSVIENMAVGTPVITYNTGGIPELVGHMETGYIAEYANTEDYIKGVKVFLENEDLRNSASRKSAEVFQDKFTQTQMVNNYMNLYNELIKT